MRFRRRRDLVCREAVELMSDYVEGALSKQDSARLEAHLAGCPHCTRYLEQIRATISARRRRASRLTVAPRGAGRTKF